MNKFAQRAGPSERFSINWMSMVIVLGPPVREEAVEKNYLEMSKLEDLSVGDWETLRPFLVFVVGLNNNKLNRGSKKKGFIVPDVEEWRAEVQCLISQFKKY